MLLSFRQRTPPAQVGQAEGDTYCRKKQHTCREHITQCLSKRTLQRAASVMRAGPQQMWWRGGEEAGVLHRWNTVSKQEKIHA